VELLDRKVRFKVCDIFHPQPGTVLHEIYGESVLEGKVLNITENSGGCEFAVIAVYSLKNPVLVAVQHVTAVSTEKGGPQ
jgi:hypothetical protein